MLSSTKWYANGAGGGLCTQPDQTPGVDALRAASGKAALPDSARLTLVACGAQTAKQTGAEATWACVAVAIGIGMTLALVGANDNDSSSSSGNKLIVLCVLRASFLRLLFFCAVLCFWRFVMGGLFDARRTRKRHESERERHK